MAGRKRKANGENKPKEQIKNRNDIPVIDPERPIEQYIGEIDPRLPHPNDIDQPSDHDLLNKDSLDEKKEGERFDNFEIAGEVARRGGATCNSVMLMKHSKPYPMWFDEFLCPRVMTGKWCGYVAYAFRRRIRFGSWPNWQHVPEDVKDEAWEDVLSSWDIRTKLSDKDHAALKKQWTTYASNKMRNWRTKVADRYIWDIEKHPNLGNPWEKYRWMDEKEWELFESYRRSDKFAKLREAGKASAKQKKYRHHTGSGGYRVIYIRLAKKMRAEAIEERIARGMTQQEAEAEVRKMYFRVDRSIVFLEANKKKGTDEFSEQFVRDLEQKILQLNLDVKEGKLKLDGKADILSIATEKADPPGRYRACSGTAKQAEALPHYTRQRGPNMNKDSSSAEAPKNQNIDFQKLDDFAGWVCQQAGVEMPADISPRDFFHESEILSSPSESKRSNVNTQAAGGEPEVGDSDDKGGIPCHLQVRDRDGEIITASAGLVLRARPTSLQVMPYTKCVKICEPIFTPNASVHFYSREYPTVGKAIGIPMNWPEEFIDYKMKKPMNEVRSEDSGSAASSDRDDNPSQHPESPDLNLIDEKFSTLYVDPLKEFAHHKRDPAARKEFLDFCKEMQRAPGRRDGYELSMEGIFGPTTQSVMIFIKDCIIWINKAKAPARKMWIETNQMNLWSSFLHARIPPEDQGRTQFIHTYSSYMNFTDPDASRQHVVDNVLGVMKAHPARLYVMPICVKEHWTLLLLVPEKSAVYCIDPNKQIITPATRPLELNILIGIGAAYDAQIRNEYTTWTVTNIIHKVQPANWECGYYCMLYMEKIVLLHNHVDVHEVFPEDEDAYPMQIINGLIDTYSRTFLQRIAPMCRDINENPPVPATISKAMLEQREVIEMD